MARATEIVEKWEGAISRKLGRCRCGIPVLFAVFSLPVFLIVAYLVIETQRDSATETLTEATKAQNLVHAKAITHTYIRYISYLLSLGIGDKPEAIPEAVERSGLVEKIQAHVASSGVLNFKIYDLDGNTIFSLHGEELGQNIMPCGCFSAALAGKLPSELVMVADGHHGKEGVPSHVDLDRDVLTTLMRMSVVFPQQTASAHIGMHSHMFVDGVLEVQSDVTPLLAGIAAKRSETIMTVALPLAVLYVIMVAIVLFVHLSIIRRDEKAREMAATVARSDAANRAKSEFLSLMSHELRTPLNAIIGFADLIGLTVKDNEKPDEEEESPIRRYAQTIVDSGHHMLRQIVSILDLTALELGELDLDVRPMQVTDVVQAAVDKVRDLFDRNLVTLIERDVPELPLVAGDPEKLQQVFENLLSNAARFTPAGGQVEIGFGQEADGSVLIGIQDSGVGMTREEIERARTPFQQDWHGYSRNSDGTGLGLTIADRVVRQLHGSLQIESAKEVGTLVVVRLPAVCAIPDAPAVDAPEVLDDADIDIPVSELEVTEAAPRDCAEPRDSSLMGDTYASSLPRSYDPAHADASWMSPREKSEQRSMASVYAARKNVA